MSNNISLIRTVLGEDILAVVEWPLTGNPNSIVDTEDYVLKRPMRIMAGPGRDGKNIEVGLGEAVPFGVTPNAEITLKGSKIIYITKPNPQFEPMYKQATMPTNLILPQAPNIRLVA